MVRQRNRAAAPLGAQSSDAPVPPPSPPSVPSRGGALRQLVAVTRAGPTGQSAPDEELPGEELSERLAWLRVRLGVPPGGPLPPGRSSMNGDGAPVEACLSVGARGVSCRWLWDPGYAEPDPSRRWQFAQTEALSRAPAALAPALASMLRDLGPTSAAELQRSPAGFLWLGAAPEAPGLAVYLDMARYPGASAFARAAAWLEAVLPDPAPARATAAALAGVGELASVGLEGRNEDDARVKLYWRLRTPTPLPALAGGGYDQPALLHFLERLHEGRRARLSGLVFGVGFHRASGALLDVKADVCGCTRCGGRPGPMWRDLLLALAGPLGLDTTALAEAAAQGVPVAFLGLGVAAGEGTGGPAALSAACPVPRLRLNLYLRPPDGPTWRASSSR